MSHEVRTPVNGVLGMLELLAGATQPERRRYFTATAKRSGEQLLQIIKIFGPRAGSFVPSQIGKSDDIHGDPIKLCLHAICAAFIKSHTVDFIHDFDANGWMTPLVGSPFPIS